MASSSCRPPELNVGGKADPGSVQQERAATHQIARQGPEMPEHDDGAGEHARRAVVAGVAFDQQQPAPHAVARAITGIAPDDDGAAAHAVQFARAA